MVVSFGIIDVDILNFGNIDEQNMVEIWIGCCVCWLINVSTDNSYDKID